MAKILGIVKTHFIALICAVVAVAAIGIGFVGMSSEKVKEDMQAVISQTKATSISNLRSNAQNRDTIAAERQRSERIAAEVEEVQAALREINAREPLMSGVFPVPESDGRAIEFREVYAEALTRLPRGLNAGTLPSDVEVKEEEQNVADLIQLEQEKRAETQVETTRQPAVAAAPPAMSGGGRFGGGRMAGARAPGAGAQPGGLEVPTDDPKFNPLYRARVAKARSIWMYYDGDITFQATPVATPSATPPEMKDVWLSQMSLWIQRDVLDAIQGLNGSAAERVDSDEGASVGEMPVKRLRYIRATHYVLPGGGRMDFPGAMIPPDAPKPPAYFGKSFTQQQSNDKYDVVRFVVCAIVDQRDVLKFIDAITKANFYRCVNVSYGAIDRERHREQLGYFYGPDPVVQLTLEFEGYFLREVYNDLMPPVVLEELQGGGGGM